MKRLRLLFLAIPALFMLGGCPTSTEKETLSSGLSATIFGRCQYPAIVWGGGLGATQIWADTSIAVGSDDKVNLLHKSSAGTLIYTRKDGDTWVSKTQWPSSFDGGGGNNSIALDRDNKVVITSTLSDGYDEDIVCVTNQSGLWDIKTVEARLSVGVANTVAVDSQNNAHVVYWFWNRSGLRYATNKGGSWNIKPLEMKGVAWMPNSIVIDSRDNPHIFYTMDAYEPGIWHATNESGEWQFELVWEKDNCPSVAIDSHDQFHVVTKEGDLLTKVDGQWTRERNLFEEMTLATFDDMPLTGEIGYHIDDDALAVDQNDKLHFTFLQHFPGRHGEVMLVYYATNVSGQWQAAIVHKWETDIPHIFPPALTLDKTGNVHLIFVNTAFDNVDDYRVRYVSFSPTAL